MHKTKEEREEDGAERKKEPWQLVCWRTTTVIVHGKRTVVVNRDHETMSISADEWWREGWYTQTKEVNRKNAEGALANDLSR